MDQRTKLKHPMQPVGEDDEGVIRFKHNPLVRHLLDFATARGCSLNQLALIEATKDDHAQLAQLIGYSVSGFSELPYVTDAMYARAEALAQQVKPRRKKKLAVAE